MIGTWKPVLIVAAVIAGWAIIGVTAQQPPAAPPAGGPGGITGDGSGSGPGGTGAGTPAEAKRGMSARLTSPSSCGWCTSTPAAVCATSRVATSRIRRSVSPCGAGDAYWRPKLDCVVAAFEDHGCAALFA